MAVTINDIKKLRDMTGAGLSDCKKALIEAENDMDKALELIRKRGQAIAAKREDREAAQGIAKGKSVGNFAAIIGLKCETDFVAKNEKFVNLANQILDAAVENKVKSLDELNALVIDGKTVPEAITALSGITGEKMELGAYECLEAPSTVVYNHFNGMLSAIVAFNLPDVEEGEPMHGCMKFDNEGRLERLIGNVGGCIVPGRFDLPTQQGYWQFDEESFREDAVILDRCQVKQVQLLDKERRPVVTVDMKTPALGIWSPYGKNASFVCIEPWFGLHDSVEYQGDFRKKYLMNHLQPGASFLSEYTITIG